MSIIQGNAHTSAGGGLQIERSLRFNSADSAYLNRTPASAGSRTTWTWSGWVKRAALGTSQYILQARISDNANDTDKLTFRFTVNNTLILQSQVTTFRETTAVYRDTSAWYHVVLTADTSNATANNRFRIYVNGVEQVFSTTNNPTSGLTTAVNSANAHWIGSEQGVASYLSAYLTEINLIDGQALTPSSFGETDSNTGVWKPKAYTGTYGTNGFELSFADNSGTTSTTLGKDSSGNGNNWTPNNFSVTAGAGNDSLVDSPTNYGTDTGVGGEVRGNYCTFNPLDKNSNGTLVNGNLDHSNSSANDASTRSTFAFPSSDKWYAELRVNTTTSGSIGHGFGFATSTASLTDAASTANKYTIYASSSISIFSNGSTITSGAGVFTAGDIIQVAYDGATGKAWLGRNNTWYNSTGGTTGNPGAGTNQTFTLTGQMFIYSYCFSASGSLNCGQRAFAYTAPSGFKALCTQNLPTPTIGATSTTQANDYFNAVLYTGNGATGQTITGVGFQPDFVWAKSRSNAYDNGLQDAVRGATKDLNSNNTDAEETRASSITAFASDGFTLGGNDLVYNGSGATYVAWNWKANGAGSSNTAGTITSTVSANTTSGFSIVTYTGNGSTSPYPTVGHGLGITPKIYVVKRRGAIGNWVFWHTIVDNSLDFMYLNTTAANASSAIGTVPTSTVMTVGGADANASGSTYVAYCFAPVAGYSAFGIYTGNGSADGPFVYTGFRPRYLLTKESSASGQEWFIWDTARDTYNQMQNEIFPNSSAAENATSWTNQPFIDFTSNGFKLRSINTHINNSGSTFIYAAFAEHPFKYSLAR